MASKKADIQLAVHYWEGRWLEAMTDQFNRCPLNSGKDDKMEKYKTRAMLTPCFVSTFYMAPKFFCYSRAIGYRDDGRPLWDSPPLTDYVDLLIVDESGRVTPELGVAIFALAKKAATMDEVRLL